MTDRVRISITKVSVALGLIITVVTLIAGGVRIVDLTSQTASTVETLSNRIEAEREDRKADNTKLLVKLSEIDTRLLYIQQGIDSIGGQNGKN